MNDYELEHECSEYAKDHGVWRPKQHWRGVGLGESEQDFEFINKAGDKVTFTATGYMDEYIPGNYVDREPEYPEPVVFVRDIEVTPMLKATEDELRDTGLTDYGHGCFSTKLGDNLYIEVFLKSGEVLLSYGIDTKVQQLYIRTADELKTILSAFGIENESSHV